MYPTHLLINNAINECTFEKLHIYPLLFMFYRLFMCLCACMSLQELVNAFHYTKFYFIVSFSFFFSLNYCVFEGVLAVWECINLGTFS